MVVQSKFLGNAKFFCILCNLYLSLILAGCLTLQEPDQRNPTLVIGEINFVSDYSNYTIKSGIKINLRSIDTGKMISFVSQDTGLFISRILQEGIYEIISYSFDTHYAGFTIKTIRPERWKYFTVIKGKVNNLGLIVYRDNKIDYMQKYNSIVEKFNENYPNSGWNFIEWINRGYPINPENWEPSQLGRKCIITRTDETRYQELWVLWNLLAGKNIQSYPKPAPNERVEDWIANNIHLVPETEITEFLLGSDPEGPDTIEFQIITRKVPRHIERLSMYEFHYKSLGGSDFGTITLAWN
jgi:hypothetical protein